MPNRPQTTFASIQCSNTTQLLHIWQILRVSGSVLGAGGEPVTQRGVTDRKCNSVYEVVWENPTTECVEVLIPRELDSYMLQWEMINLGIWVGGLCVCSVCAYSSVYVCVQYVALVSENENVHVQDRDLCGGCK